MMTTSAAKNHRAKNSLMGLGGGGLQEKATAMTMTTALPTTMDNNSSSNSSSNSKNNKLENQARKHTDVIKKNDRTKVGLDFAGGQEKAMVTTTSTALTGTMSNKNNNTLESQERKLPDVFKKNNTTKDNRPIGGLDGAGWQKEATAMQY